jgi:diacylglycerol kinase (ATP)
MRPRPRSLAILNPNAGGDASSTADRIAEACNGLAGKLEIAQTTRAGEATTIVVGALAAPEAPEVVLALGGDGTAREVAEGIARGTGRWLGGGERAAPSTSGPVMLALPMGSGNSLYRAAWGERAWREALEAALDRRVRCVRTFDLIRLVEADRASLLGVNFGLIAGVAARIERRKLGIGPDAGTAADGAPSGDEQRYWEAFGEVLHDFEPPELRVTVDDIVVHDGSTTLVSVGGVRRYGRGSFELLPRSVIDDALLDACVVEALTAERLGELAQLVPSGGHVGEREVVYVQGHRVRVERLDAASLDLEHDGDPCDGGRVLTLEAVERAVPTVVAPDSTLRI